jgi:hypothetical protein
MLLASGLVQFDCVAGTFTEYSAGTITCVDQSKVISSGQLAGYNHYQTCEAEFLQGTTVYAGHTKNKCGGFGFPQI